MKKIIANILIIALLFFGIGGTLAVPKVAHAACSIGSVVVGNGIIDCVNDVVVSAVMPIIGKFLQLTAYLFDHAITLNMNIAQFLQKCTGAECAASPVEVVWKLIRDISGMFFIFILIWSSIKMILSGESNKSMIVGIVLAGLLVNFSLFATKIVIDASNSLTLTIYNAITPNYNPTIAQSIGFGAQDVNRQIPGSISSKIMQVVDLQSLYANTSSSAKKTNFNVSSIIATVGGISLMLVLGIAFLAAGLMFLWRFIMLLVLMAFSPIPALALAFPQLRDKSKDFTKNLMNQCLFAPVFLFFLYIAMKVMTDPSFVALSNPDKSTFAATFAGGGSIAPLIQYCLVIFIIFFGLLAAKGFGMKGADFGINGVNWLSKMGQGAVRGSGAWLGRETYGRAANYAADSEKLKDLASRSPAIAGLALKGVRSVSKSYKETTSTKAESRVKFAESLGYNKNKVGDLEDDISHNQSIIDSYNKELADPTITDAKRSRLLVDIKALEVSNREIKKRVATERLRRQTNVASGADPRRNLKTGELDQPLSILQRVKHLNNVSDEDEQVSEQLAVKNVEQVLKDKVEALEKRTKKRDELKRDIAKREKEIITSNTGATPARLLALMAADVYLSGRKAEFHDEVAGKINPATKLREGGIVDAEAEIRKIKATLAKIK